MNNGSNGILDAIEGNMVRTEAGFRAGLRLLQTVIATVLLAPGAAFAAKEWNLPPPVTTIAQQMFDLHAYTSGSASSSSSASSA